MIRLNQIKISIFDMGSGGDGQEAVLRTRAARLLRCREEDIRKLRIVKRSVDARDRDDIRYVYTLDVKLRDSVAGPSAQTEREYAARLRNKNICIVNTVPFSIPTAGGAGGSGIAGHRAETGGTGESKAVSHMTRTGCNAGGSGIAGHRAEAGGAGESRAAGRGAEAGGTGGSRAAGRRSAAGGGAGWAGAACGTRHGQGYIRRPVIIGSGPCGLFAAIALVEAGLRPIIVERGDRVEERVRKTEAFLGTERAGISAGACLNPGTNTDGLVLTGLDPDSNIQFGEGGAGTFSDGKLNTGVKDRDGYIGYVLRTFVRFGAKESILYDQKPHIGTDELVGIIRNIREYIEEHGGSYLFNTRLDNIEISNSILRKLYCTDLKTCTTIELPAGAVILATGHSARDTYEMLGSRNVLLEPKAFAVGVRVQHPQELIDRGLYGSSRLEEKRRLLGAASYKLTSRSSDGRGVYTFCMCPGGYVINSSSEPGRLCINGMSLSTRDSGTANSAVIVTVAPEDYGGEQPLSGVAFQRELERRAYELAGGAIPYETFGEFRQWAAEPEGRTDCPLRFRGSARAADVRSILPEFICRDIIEGMQDFGRKLKGFDYDGAVIAGVEARTSSPVRIVRDGGFEAPGIKGLYPAGEGAGYAGGITSAAADGVRIAMRLIMTDGTR